MVRPAMLSALERVARLRAEQELKKLAAFRRHVLAAHHQVEASRAAMAQSYAAQAPLSVAEARMANAQAGRAARDLARAQADLARMQPRFDQMRERAGRELGRAEVLSRMAETALLAVRQRRERGQMEE
ncbi:hypothetical protein KY389_01940 [Paracoccus bogoriensis]|uniref:hypothetical protein n=1 Tax=Paracoccus bogoriensis TaxID=242065 RepID=UPI001CA5EDCD|nr:hypothetical protein [Paracoccus bogoriensis]MBW7055455.1 hypothetical protein [Paracoccus bogoriensis]